MVYYLHLEDDDELGHIYQGPPEVIRDNSATPRDTRDNRNQGSVLICEVKNVKRLFSHWRYIHGR